MSSLAQTPATHRPWSIGVLRDAAMLGAAYFVTALASIYLSHEPGNIGAVWFANAAAIVFLVRRPIDQWPLLVGATALANLLANVLHGDGLIVSLTFVPGNAMDVVVGSWLLTRRGWHIGFDETPRKFARMLLAGAVMPPLIGATCGAVVIAWHGWARFQPVWMGWYVGGVVGAMALLPIGLSVNSTMRTQATLAASGRFIALISGVMGLTWLGMNMIPLPLVYVALLLILVALWAGPLATFSLCLAESFLIVVALAHGTIATPHLTPPWQHVAVFVPIIAIVLPAQLLAITVAGLRQALSLAHQSRARYQLLYDTAPVMLHSIDAKGQLVMVNHKWLQTLGFRSAQEVLGRAATDFLAVDDAALQPVKVENRPTLIAQPGRMTTRDGRPLSVLYAYTAVPRDEALADAGVFAIEDMSERLRIQGEVESQRNRLAALTSATADLAAFIGPDGEIQAVNRAWAHVAGKAQGELVGHALEHAFADAHFHALVKRELAQALAGRVSRQRLSLWMPDLGARTMDVLLQPARDANDQVVGVMVTAHDVHELVLSKQYLQQTVGSLQQANERLQQFARISAHDLREPLNAIIGFTRLIELDGAARLDDLTRKHLALVSGSAERMKAMLDDLLQFVRLDAIDTLAMQPVDLSEVLASASQALTALLKSNHAHLQIGVLPVVEGQASLLALVFQNLIGNAVKFMPGDRTPHISVESKQVGGKVIVTVSDNGIGIAQDQIPRLFKPFVRLHTQREHQGTGLGLAIVDSIAQAHGGRVWCTSQGNVGSQFHVELMPANTPALIQ